MSLTRREMIGRLAGFTAGAAGLASYVASEGCTPTQTQNFINILDTVATGIELALPVVGALVPGYALISGAVDTFLKLANNAADATAVVLSGTDTTATRFSKILSIWSLVVLDPNVLHQLPATIGALSPATLINVLVADINLLLGKIAATIPGAAAVAAPNNAVVAVAVPVAAAHLTFPKLNLPFGSGGQLKKILDTTRHNGEILGR